MSLKNEAQSAFEHTKSFYREYVDGMSRQRIGKEFNSDTDRLKRLYIEAIQAEDQNRNRPMPGHQKLLNLLSQLTQRLNPTRRLLFGLSMVAFIFYYLFGFFGIGRFILFYDLFIPFAFVSMLLLLLIELLEKTDVKQELELARDIQLSLLPSTQFEVNDIEISSFASTAKDVGGDYVELIETDEGIYKIIADVSGKGLSAALYMVRLQALVHLIIEKQKPTPKELFLTLNDFVKSDKSNKIFVTACAAFFPNNKEEMRYARAGHNPPILYSKNRDDVFELRSDGYALGMTSTPILKKHLKEKTFHFKQGDSLLFYTDGLTEARNNRGEEFGIKRLKAILTIYGSLHAETIMTKVQNSLEDFIADEKLFDDVTFSCTHRKEETAN